MIQSIQKAPQLSKTSATFIRKLNKHSVRKENNQILVEGIKCCYELLNSNFNTLFLVVNSDSISQALESISTIAHQKNIPVFQTKASIFTTLCDTQHPQPIIAIARPANNSILNNQSFVALDNINDPGNVGTIIRTCEWFRIRQVLLIGKCADKYSPKVIRASMGSVFRMNIISTENDINIFQKHFNQINIFAASLKNSMPMDVIKHESSSKFGLIVGNESRGISSFLDNIISSYFHIERSYNLPCSSHSQTLFGAGAPALGEAESLNVAVATGIALNYFVRHACTL